MAVARSEKLPQRQQVLLDEDKFQCSICLDLMKFPVSVPCGHNYCSRCIESYWDKNEQTPRVRCPQCRQTFDPRPELKKNLMLNEVVAILKKTALEGIIPERCYAGPKDVGCDVCDGRKQKAVLTCLQCLVSYCEPHVQPHHLSPAFKNHKLVKVSTHLQENLGITERIQQRVEEVNLLHLEAETINDSADKAARNSDTAFAELISTIERRRSQVRELIREQQRLETNRAEQQKKRVEAAAVELRRGHAELEQLHRADALHVKHSYNSLNRIQVTAHLRTRADRPLRHFDDVAVAVQRLRGKMEAALEGEAAKIHAAVRRPDVLLSTLEPRTRAEFVKYGINLWLDPNTHHQHLVMALGNLSVENTNVVNPHPHHPDRFSECWQCLATEPLTGRHYWEVQWGGDYVDVAVAYPDITRNGDMERRFGLNAKTWCLQCWHEGCYFRHKESGHEINMPVSQRVGVYLDHNAGVLCWFSITDTMTLLKRVETTFTRPLLPGFWCSDHSSMTMVHDVK